MLMQAETDSFKGMDLCKKDHLIEQLCKQYKITFNLLLQIDENFLYSVHDFRTDNGNHQIDISPRSYTSCINYGNNEDGTALCWQWPLPSQLCSLACPSAEFISGIMIHGLSEANISTKYSCTLEIISYKVSFFAFIHHEAGTLLWH